MVVVLYIVFFIFCIAAENSSKTQKNVFLAITLVAVSLMAGYRDVAFWPDTPGYRAAFLSNTPSFSNYVFGSNPPDYQDKGFFFLSVLIKTLTSDWVAYATIIAFIGLWILIKGINKYSMFPLFAFALYMSRFMFGRQFIQIRAGVSIAIVFWGMQYVAKRDLKRYLVVIFVASLLHMSAWIALPAYFLHKIKLKPKHIYWSIGVAFVVLPNADSCLVYFLGKETV